MTILGWIFAIFLIAFVAVFSLLIVVGIVVVLIGLFAKGYDASREQIIHERYRK